MSKIWTFMLLISITVAIVFGNPETVINSITTSGKSAVENILTLAGMMCFWSGIFNVFENTNAIKSFSRFFAKFISKIFDKKELNEKSIGYMSMNISTNMLGVGNAATVNGIRAMEELQKENKYKERPTNNMTTFVLLNTASLQIIPTNMIALRTLYGSSNPTAIVVPIWIVSITSLIIGFIAIKILNRKMV